MLGSYKNWTAELPEDTILVETINNTKKKNLVIIE
jgi:hypothetical protein